MGSQCLWNTICSLTLAFLFCVCLKSLSASATLSSAERERLRRSVLRDLRLDNVPDVTKFNVSQAEYTHMMTIYLQRLHANNSPSKSIPKLFNYEYIERPQRRRNDANSRLHFTVSGPRRNSEVESATLRILAPPLQGTAPIRIQVYQILSTRRRRLLDKRDVYLSEEAPKWMELDVTKGVQSWINGERNLGLEIKCPDCERRNGSLIATHLPAPTISALVHVHSRRRRRTAEPVIYQKNRRTDCQKSSGKQRCCRHKMQITFNDLEGMESILHPKTFDVGYCQGRCPPLYNLAHNHAKIQSLMWKRNHTYPRVCCAPSNLAHLEILTVDIQDPTKLRVQTWENTEVLECACS